MSAYIRSVLLAAAAVFVSPLADADPLCESVKTVLAAGDERPIPYDSLVAVDARRSPEGKLKSIVAIPPLRGLSDGAVCHRYLAGLADGIVGGGTRNFVECNLGRAEGAELGAQKETRAHLIGQLHACLAPGSWTGGEIQNANTGRLMIERAVFKAPDGAAQIQIETEARTLRSRDSQATTSHAMRLQISTPSLYVPQPKPTP